MATTWLRLLALAADANKPVMSVGCFRVMRDSHANFYGVDARPKR